MGSAFFMAACAPSLLSWWNCSMFLRKWRRATVTTHRCTALVSIFLLFTCAGLGRGAEAASELNESLKTLQGAGVAADGPALLAFFRDRTLTEAKKRELAAKVKRLGDNSFGVREKAARELVAAGQAAVPFLKAGLKEPDLEVSRRAGQCLEAIESGTDRAIVTAAAVVLTSRRPAGAADVLLTYLPSSGDDAVEEAVVNALAVVGLRDGAAESAVEKAVTDKDVIRRAAAAFVLGKARPEQRAALTILIKDKDAKVRYHAARSLARTGDKAAVPPLIRLLGEAPEGIAAQTEDLLFTLAGEKAPTVSLGNDEASRKNCQETWEKWWKTNSDKVEMARLTAEEPLLGLTVISELDGGKGLGKVWECGQDGKPRWLFEDVRSPIDVRPLPGGRLLVAEHQGNRVTERDRKGKILWEQRTNNMPVCCQRLPNGNTFIATYNELLEVNRENKPVYSHTKPHGIYYAMKLRNNHILYVHSGGQLVEMDTAGKEVRTVPAGNTASWASVEALANGHFLVALYGVNKVVEIDAAGKEVWSANVQNPSHATRLKNGNTLVATPEGRKVAELDRAGKEVWKTTTQGRVWRARRY